MTPRFNLFFRLFANRFFRHFDLDDATVERLRELESRGTVVYVMRYASRLDYFLFNALFRREGLRLSSFANGILFYYYRPLRDALRVIWKRPRGVAQDVELVRNRDYARGLTGAQESFFLFLRTASLRSQLRARRRAIEQARTERDLLAEVVGAFNLSYGAATRPSDLAKVTSFLTTYRGLHVKVGDPIDLGGFIEMRRAEGPQAVARIVRRILLTFLYREERVVEGPVLQPRQRVQEIVVRNPAVQEAIRERAREKRVGPDRARAQAERMFREIAANMNSTFLAVLDFLVGAITRRLFVSIEVSGIEKVTDYAKRNPLVLVPSHRSYFDFIIISLLFYGRHILPPHIAARDNMAFGPFGFIWRRAGAFFMRRSFDDDLYKAVFRTYVSHLIKEGFTQEFFIEGGRSRTGKTLAPRLGMLSWDVEAFLTSGRRDLFFVPIAITYERLVEEGSMVGELEGQEKRPESMLALVRARKFLQRRFGSVFVNFGEPISLADALGERRERFVGDDTPEVRDERRAFVESMGHRIVERINWAVVPSATAVGACALLGERRRGFFREDLARSSARTSRAACSRSWSCCACRTCGSRPRSTTTRESTPSPSRRCCAWTSSGRRATRAARSSTSTSRSAALSTSTATRSSTTWRRRAFSPGACSWVQSSRTSTPTPPCGSTSSTRSSSPTGARCSRPTFPPSSTTSSARGRSNAWTAACGRPRRRLHTSASSPSRRGPSWSPTTRCSVWRFRRMRRCPRRSCARPPRNSSRAAPCSGRSSCPRRRIR
jgi:glycerol-3-phosphate O-acyltransferase